MTTILGLTPFKLALGLEIAANIASLPATMFDPTQAAAILFSSSVANTTAASLTLARWFGGLVAALTVPLILSFPSPEPGAAGEAQRGFRRATHITMGAGEVFLGGLMAQGYLSGQDTGIKQNALLFGALNMFTLLGVRVLFLVLKPEWIREEVDKSKAYKGQ